MKIKKAVRMFLPVLCMLSLTGCDGEFPFISWNPAETVTGKVNSIEGGSISIQVGVWKEAEDGENSVPDLELTEEEQTIQVTKETVIRLQDTDRQAEDEETGEDTSENETVENEAGGDEKEEDVKALSVEDLREGDVLSVSLDKGNQPLEILIISRGSSGSRRKSREAEDYDAATEFAVDMETDGEKYTSTGIDENAVHVFGDAQVTLKNAEISRMSPDSTGGSTASIYGVGAALLTTNGISVIRDSRITTNAPGGSGIFSDGEAVTYAMNTAVMTLQNTSGGIQTAGGGTLYAWNLDVETKGASSPAVKSDQGGGTIVVDGGSYRTNGTNSPVVYSMADIAVHEAKLAADASGAVVINGPNALRLYDCDLTGNMGDDLNNDSAWNVLLYQNTSEEDNPEKSIFEMQGGTLTASNGGIFYTTNTKSAITLSDVKILYPDVRDYFLKCTGNEHQAGWGEEGANGSKCVFTAVSQDVEGDVIWDDISQLDLYLTKNSTLRGAVLKDKSYAGEQDGYCHLYLEEGSAWIVTGNSTLTRLSSKGKILDEEGQTVTVRGTDGTTYVQGNGKYTITVLYYEMAANLSGASEMTPWTDHQAALPE